MRKKIVLFIRDIRIDYLFKNLPTHSKEYNLLKKKKREFVIVLRVLDLNLGKVYSNVFIDTGYLHF